MNEDKPPENGLAKRERNLSVLREAWVEGSAAYEVRLKSTYFRMQDIGVGHTAFEVPGKTPHTCRKSSASEVVPGCKGDKGHPETHSALSSGTLKSNQHSLEWEDLTWLLRTLNTTASGLPSHYTGVLWLP